MITGKPIVFATSVASSTLLTAPSLPGMIGTPAAFAVSRARALSPMRRMASGGGPMNVSRHSPTISAKCGFSERKP
jgi:hypothetical protein